MRILTWTCFHLAITAAALLVGCGDDSSAEETTGSGGSGGSGGATGTGTGSGTSTATGSGGSGGQGAGSGCEVPDPAARDAICTTAAEALCAFDARCSPGLVDVTFGSMTACVEARRGECNDRRNVDEQGLTACYEAVVEAAAGPGCAPPMGGDRRALCGAIGLLEEGAPCWDDLECASANCGASYLSCGACEPRVAPGDPCPTEDCGHELYCYPSGCGAPPTRGEVCDWFISSFCDDGTNCEPFADGVNDICEGARLVGEGAACGADECDPELGLVCVDGACAPYQESSAGLGDPCEPTATSRYGFTVTSDTCGGDLRCVGTGTCAESLPNGSACAQGRECASLHCADGTCTSGRGSCACDP